ncbi:hypothetical protein [Streptomyces griseoruber]|uniref:Uncharacterized protein n=1 Tax=Streptomyces griseoruber TaxID=1943 RepID=A0A117RGC4_9ACTN|nr:hypothetical protein [Streptomyces griseoruber]KUN89276.1 hypothetical protein AQJ64_00945 [Streptomyces griseoruber]
MAWPGAKAVDEERGDDTPAGGCASTCCAGITDLALLRDQHEVFGPVVSTPTARETARLQAAGTGRGIPPACAGGRDLRGPLDKGGIALELTCGGIPGFLRANTSGQMVRHVLKSFRDAARSAHPG